MGDECPNCVGGELLWSDVYQAWECDECGTLVAFDAAADGPDSHVEVTLHGEQEVKPDA
jgi:uncharacterized protein (DUF983 family)